MNGKGMNLETLFLCPLIPCRSPNRFGGASDLVSRLLAVVSSLWLEKIGAQRRRYTQYTSTDTDTSKKAARTNLPRRLV